MKKLFRDLVHDIIEPFWMVGAAFVFVFGAFGFLREYVGSDE